VIITPNVASIIVDQIRRYLMLEEVSRRERCYSSPVEAVTDDTSGRHVSEDRFLNSPGTGSCRNRGRELSQSLAKLEQAYMHKVLYIMGKRADENQGRCFIF
jgi:KUP system potassium uptake protein